MSKREMSTKTVSAPIRDYTVGGAEARYAVEKGLADATWYTSPVPPEEMRKLLIRKNGPAIRDTLLWFSIIFGSGFLTFYLWGTWWFILPYIVYAAVYTSTSDSRWHESSHGTAFKSDWMNNVLYEIASFFVVRESVVWRWSHTRHHSDTIIRGRDPEIAVPRPPNIKKMIIGLFGVYMIKGEFKKILTHAFGKIEPEIADFLPKSEYKKVFWRARIYVLIYASVIFLSLYYWTILPLLFVGLPTIFGAWLMPVYGVTQHAGLAENVLDHRLNCRTVYMNRLNRFLYWNMNYHVEHHMFPLVPYHNLPKLHELIKDDCPPAYGGLKEAWKEIIYAVRKQVKDPTFHIKRELPTPSLITPPSHSKIYVGNKETITLDGYLEVCNSQDMTEQNVIRFDYEENTFALYRDDENKYYATDGICTHGNTHLANGLVIGKQIECPKHNGRFNFQDGSTKRPPVCIPLNTYPVVEREGKLYIDVLNPKNRSSKKVEDKYSFKVVSNKNVSTFIKELVLEPIERNKFKYKPGQYFQMEIPEYELRFSKLNIEKPFSETWKKQNLLENYVINKFKVFRNFSVGSDPDTENQLRFNVRIEFPPPGTSFNAGVGSSYVFQLKPGDIVKARGPFGDFLIQDTQKEMIYVGGGAGMAPLRSHLANLFESKKTNRKVSFWYGARSLKELFYDDYFKKLEYENKNFSFHVALSDPLPDDNWNSYKGYIHDVVNREYLAKQELDILNVEFYLCGPPPMIQAMIKLLKGYNVRDEQIRFDEF